MPNLRSSRLQLRQWTASDHAPFAQLNGDPHAMRFFAQPLCRADSDALAQRCAALIAQRGWGFWAAECVQTGAFIGMMGLHVPAPELPCAPCVEVGWRLLPAYWGRGLATEGAQLALHYGFAVLQLREIVAFTALPNLPSQAVMQRLGMQRDVQTFEHPALPPGHGLRTHCLYRLDRTAFLSRTQARPHHPAP